MKRARWRHRSQTATRFLLFLFFEIALVGIIFENRRCLNVDGDNERGSNKRRWFSSGMRLCLRNVNNTQRNDCFCWTNCWFVLWWRVEIVFQVIFAAFSKWSLSYHVNQVIWLVNNPWHKTMAFLRLWLIIKLSSRRQSHTFRSVIEGALPNGSPRDFAWLLVCSRFSRFPSCQYVRFT